MSPSAFTTPSIFVVDDAYEEIGDIRFLVRDEATHELLGIMVLDYLSQPEHLRTGAFFTEELKKNYNIQNADHVEGVIRAKITAWGEHLNSLPG